MLNILLAFIPITALLEWLKPDWHSAIFIASAMAIIPLAGWLSHATEQLAERTGEGIGGLLNATFGNAAEHTAAIVVARKNRLDLALSIAVGSGVQIALFVAPVLVFLSYFIGPQPFDLIFGTKLVLLIFMAILIIGQIASDGESNWLKGVQLLAIYYILGVALYFVPADLLQPK